MSGHPYPALRRVVAGALDCIRQGTRLMGEGGDWAVEEFMDHLMADVTPESRADLARLLADTAPRSGEEPDGF